NISQSGSSLLNSSGAVNLTGSALSTVLVVGFTPSLGQQYTIVQTTGALTGTFAGLPDQAQFSSGVVTFQIHYQTATSPAQVVLTACAFPQTLIGYPPGSSRPGHPGPLPAPNSPAGSPVPIGGVVVTFTLTSATQITATISNTAKSGPISVTNTPGGTATS